MHEDVKWKSGRAIRGKQRTVGNGGESDVQSQHLQGCSPRLCWLRTEGLVPMSKY
jgi:hypothetical protein